MLKFANVVLEFLLKFGMRYLCLSFAIDNILYIVYYTLDAIYYI
jgi:hypothetical protein